MLRLQPVVPFGFVTVKIEAAFEEAPADAGVVEQVADVRARPSATSAPVVVEQTSPTGSASLISVNPLPPSDTMSALALTLVNHAVGLAGDQVDALPEWRDRSWCRRSCRSWQTAAHNSRAR